MPVKGTLAIGRSETLYPGLDSNPRSKIQLLFRKVQNALIAKLVKHCALKKINSVTMGTE